MLPSAQALAEISILTSRVATLEATIRSITRLIQVNPTVGKIVIGGTKNTTGDPVGEEGMIYSNTADNAVRYYTDGAWRSLAIWSGGIGFTNLGDGSELTIASGEVTATKSYHTIDTESDGGTDDLDTINGGSTGDLLVLSAANDARTVVVKAGTGNISLDGDKTLNHTDDVVGLIKAADGDWVHWASEDNAA